MADLVSVVVITFNSEETIERALDSVAAQTYPAIELVVADDASQDKTLETVDRWRQTNQARFCTVKVVTSQKNRGITHNIAAGVAASAGTWVKPLAGDDELDHGAVERFVQYAHAHPEAQFMVGSVETVLDRRRLRWPSSQEFSAELSVQRRLVLSSCYCYHVGMFYARQALERIGGFDLRYRMLEDHPLLLRIADSGFPVYLVPGIAARHYVTRMSATRSQRLGLYQHPELTRDAINFFRDEIGPRQRRAGMAWLWLVFWMKIMIDCRIMPRLWRVPAIGRLVARARTVVKRAQFRLRRSIVVGRY